MAHLYLGPNRPFNLPIRKGALFRADPENVYPALTELFRTHKSLKRLFIPVEPVKELHQAIIAVQNPGTALNEHFSNVKKASAAQATAGEE